MSSFVVPPESGSPTERRVRPHILVVEDYPDTRTILTMVLTRRGGYDVTVAANAKEALRLVHERFARTTGEGTHGSVSFCNAGYGQGQLAKPVAS